MKRVTRAARRAPEGCPMESRASMGELTREGRQTDIETGTGPAPPTTLSRVASPPYAHARGRAPVGSPVGWAVLLLTSTSRAPRPRRAPRTARSLAVRDVLGAWVKGSGWGGRRGGRSGRGGLYSHVIIAAAVLARVRCRCRWLVCPCRTVPTCPRRVRPNIASAFPLPRAARCLATRIVRRPPSPRPPRPSRWSRPRACALPSPRCVSCTRSAVPSAARAARSHRTTFCRPSRPPSWRLCLPLHQRPQ